MKTTDDKIKMPPLAPSTTQVLPVTMNRKMRRARKYGQVLEPAFGQCGYKQRVQRTNEAGER